jgi:hypothetical protein
MTSARRQSLSSASSIQSIPPHPTSCRSILILSYHLRLGLPSGLLPSGFPTKTLYTPLLSSILATCPNHPILLNLITRTILGEQYRSLSSTDHQASQIIKQYRSLSSTDHQASQIIKQYRSLSSTDHQASHIIKQYRSLSSTDHQASHIIKQYRSISSTDHQASQINKQYRSLSSTDH